MLTFKKLRNLVSRVVLKKYAIFGIFDKIQQTLDLPDTKTIFSPLVRYLLLSQSIPVPLVDRRSCLRPSADEHKFLALGHHMDQRRGQLNPHQRETPVRVHVRAQSPAGRMRVGHL